jgi:hypothetical protein
VRRDRKSSGLSPLDERPAWVKKNGMSGGHSQSEVAVDEIPSPPTGQKFYRDGTLKGFTVRVIFASCLELRGPGAAYSVLFTPENALLRMKNGFYWDEL